MALEETKNTPVAAGSPSPPASAFHSHIAPIYRRCWQQTTGGTQQRLHLLHPLLLSAAADVTRKKRHITIQFPPKASKPRRAPRDDDDYSVCRKTRQWHANREDKVIRNISSESSLNALISCVICTSRRPHLTKDLSRKLQPIREAATRTSSLPRALSLCVSPPCLPPAGASHRRERDKNPARYSRVRNRSTSLFFFF